MTTPRHRAPPPPPLLGRLNESAPLRVALTAGVGLLLLGSLIGIADDMGDDLTPRARAAVTALPTRAEEPTGRGGPLAPVFDDVDAPDYPIGDGPAVSTPQGRRAVVTQRPVIATKSAEPTSQGVPDPATPGAPESTQGETLAPPVLPGLPEVPTDAEPETPTPIEDPEPIVETPTPTEPIAPPVEEPQSNPTEVAP